MNDRWNLGTRSLSADVPFERLRAEREFLSRLLDSMDVLLVVLDRTGQIVRFNRSCERLFGYTYHEIKHKMASGELPLPEEVKAIKRLLARLTNGRNQELYESQWRTSDGEWRTIQWSISVLFDQQGGPEYVVATGTDVTSRHTAERLLERERALLQALINSIPDLIFYKDNQSHYLGCNKAFEKFRRLGLKEIVGRTDVDFYPPDLANKFLASDQEVIEKRESVLYEDWTTAPNGKPVLFETRKTPYYTPDGEVLGVIGIGRDITRHRITENALRLAKVEIEQLIASLSSILIVIRPNLQILRWNPTAVEVFGKTPEEVIGRPLNEIGLQWDWEKVAQALVVCRRDLVPVNPEPVKFRRLDGSEGLLGLNVSLLRPDRDSVTGFILLSADITERKILENRLAQSQKLESIGQLAAGIAHEINTPIQYVGDNTQFLLNSFDTLVSVMGQFKELLASAKTGHIDPQQVEALNLAIEASDLDFLCQEIPLAIQQSMEGINRVTDIVRAMKEFSHPVVREKQLVDINRALTSTLAVTRNEWKYRTDVETDLAADLPKVLCLPGEINQAFLNVLINAAQAIQMALEAGTRSRGLIRIKTIQEGDWVEIRISDNGDGIPEEIQPHVFEPFFTTKEVGKGTGQGLAIAYDIVACKHGGTLTFETTTGVGTTFIIRLPIQ